MNLKSVQFYDLWLRLSKRFEISLQCEAFVGILKFINTNFCFHPSAMPFDTEYFILFI